MLRLRRLLDTSVVELDPEPHTMVHLINHAKVPCIPPCLLFFFLSYLVSSNYENGYAFPKLRLTESASDQATGVCNLWKRFYTWGLIDNQQQNNNLECGAFAQCGYKQTGLPCLCGTDFLKTAPLAAYLKPRVANSQAFLKNWDANFVLVSHIILDTKTHRSNLQH